MKALKAGLYFSIRCRQACVSSTGETAFVRIRSEACLRVRPARSFDCPRAGFKAHNVAVPRPAARKVRREVMRGFYPKFEEWDCLTACDEAHYSSRQQVQDRSREESSSMSEITRRTFFEAAGLAAVAPVLASAAVQAPQAAQVDNSDVKVERDVVYGKGGDL